MYKDIPKITQDSKHKAGWPAAWADFLKWKESRRVSASVNSWIAACIPQLPKVFAAMGVLLSHSVLFSSYDFFEGHNEFS